NYAYEWSVKQVMLNNFSKYDVFFDIGANIGTYTILMASKGLKTFSFEPVYSNFKALNINILLNNLENNAVTFNYGLSDKAADASFVFDPLNTGASHISTMPAKTIEAERRSIPTTIKLQQLDDVYQTLGLEKESKIFMKIDVEGMESQVILGAKEFLKSFPNIMIVMESVHSGEEKLKNILSQIADFEFFTIDSLNMGAIKKNEKSL
ncbi:MAG TPA: FkbM family methyltransferase, partial [Bacteroidales bacterium]|nr:FkbM family methyltransferase [Bacteroidales bacterium]